MTRIVEPVLDSAHAQLCSSLAPPLLPSSIHRYASFDYEPGPYRAADLVRLDVLAHGSAVDALARMVSPRAAPHARAGWAWRAPGCRGLPVDHYAMPLHARTISMVLADTLLAH